MHEHLDLDFRPPGQAVQALHPQPKVPVLVAGPSGDPHRPQHVPGAPEAANAPASIAAHAVTLRA